AGVRSTAARRYGVCRRQVDGRQDRPTGGNSNDRRTSVPRCDRVGAGECWDRTTGPATRDGHCATHPAPTPHKCAAGVRLPWRFNLSDQTMNGTYLLRDAHRRLTRGDSLRERCPLSRDIDDATQALLAAQTDEERATILSGWLSREQPCIFGRVAAQRELISYCFLTAADLDGSDAQITATIQTKRRAWQSLAEDGRRSPFIIVSVSESLATAAPDEHLQAFAIRLASLYLRRPVEPNRIYHDRIRLWELGFENRRQWRVGANVFAVAGDGRWWHDHRIPGGLGF